MRKFQGYVHMNVVEFEVEDDADSLQIEQAFNEAIDEIMAQGFDGSVDYDYEEVDGEEE